MEDFNEEVGEMLLKSLTGQISDFFFYFSVVNDKGFIKSIKSVLEKIWHYRIKLY